MVSWEPTPPDVKSVIPQRLNGQPFSETTTPNVEQVAAIIGDLVGEVIGEVGSFDPSDVLNPSAPPADQVTLGDLAKRAAQLGAASQIEDSFFPEQQTNAVYGAEQDGGNQHLYARYRRALELLRGAVHGATGRGQLFTGSVSAPLTTVANTGRHLDTP